MSIEMDEEIERWTACRKSALVLDIIQGKTTLSESARQFDLPPSEIESWIHQAKAGMENALKAKPEDIREQHETQLKAPQRSYGEAMLELRARKKRTVLYKISTLVGRAQNLRQVVDREAPDSGCK